MAHWLVMMESGTGASSLIIGEGIATPSLKAHSGAREGCCARLISELLVMQQWLVCSFWKDLHIFGHRS